MKRHSRRLFLQQSTLSLAAGALAGSPISAAEPRQAKDKKTIGKKGIGHALRNEQDAKKLAPLNINWLYNWNSTVSAAKAKDLEYVPMIWSGKQAKNVRERVDAIKAQGASTLLGFNEPDQKEQANMTVAQALELWPILMESGLRLGSPGAAHADREWMREFMTKAKKKKYRIDFVCVHWYWHPNPDDLLGKLRAIHKLYDLPIWITEFAVADWDTNPKKPNRFSEDDVANFLKKVLPELEKTPWVERYAWFPSGPKFPALSSSALFDKDGNLTKVGKVYATG
jgi:hypothetical protein